MQNTNIVSFVKFNLLQPKQGICKAKKIKVSAEKKCVLKSKQDQSGEVVAVVTGPGFNLSAHMVAHREPGTLTPTHIL